MLFLFAVSRLQYHFQPAASSPHAIFMQKDANGEHYLTSTTTTQQNPLYVPSPNPNPCQSTIPTGQQQHNQQQQPLPPQQFHMLRLQSNHPHPHPQNNELRTSNQTMHIKQLHTATVHGKKIPLSLVCCNFFVRIRSRLCRISVRTRWPNAKSRKNLFMISHFIVNACFSKQILYNQIMVNGSFVVLFYRFSLEYQLTMATTINHDPTTTTTIKCDDWQDWDEANFCQSHYLKK